jgi:hypothetical protein
MNQRPNITVTNRNLPSHQAANSLSSCDLFELLWNLPWQNVESKKKKSKKQVSKPRFKLAHVPNRSLQSSL